jgi:Protein of unknown function (DUF4035)
LLAQLTARQWAEWGAYYGIEPFGELREDFRAGQICGTVANYAGKVRSDQVPPANPADFMPGLAEFDRGSGAKPRGPRLLDDPIEHAKLMRKLLFNKDE